jgi:hypothetical protein
MTMSKKQTTETIDSLYRALSRLCDGRNTHNTQRMFQDLEHAARQGEKEHIAFGRRLLGHSPKRAATLTTRVRYFVVKCVLDGRPVTSAIEAYQMRADFLAGAAIALIAAASDPNDGTKAEAIAALLKAFDEIDYARDLAGA